MNQSAVTTTPVSDGVRQALEISLRGVQELLPQDEWARTILAPLVISAGYDVIADGTADDAAIAIVFDDLFEVAEALGRTLPDRVIRLREQPDAPEGCATIYRYDREALLAALGAANRVGIRTGEAA